MKLMAAVAAVFTLSALVFPADAAWGAEQTVTSRASSVHNESFLFTLQAAHGKTSGGKGKQEPFELILTGVGPVTKFSDRPFRDASYIGPRALRDNWQAWCAKTPPNAVLTYSTDRDSTPSSIVVTLTKPRYDTRNRMLSFTAVRVYRDTNLDAKNASSLRPQTPARFIKASLFIDGSNAAVNASNSAYQDEIDQQLGPPIPNDVATYGVFAGTTCYTSSYAFAQASQSGASTPQMSAAEAYCGWG